MTYPALVFGYLFVIRANRSIESAIPGSLATSLPPAKQLAANDIAIQKGGAPIETIFRFHSALRELTGRRGIRNDLSRYEAIALALIDMDKNQMGTVFPSFPPAESPLRIEQFFSALYLRYDERYVFSAPDLKSTTARIGWSPNSPAFSDPRYLSLDYKARLADQDE